MDNPKITEKEIGIIKRAQAGDELAFNTLYKKYKRFVEKVIFSYLKDEDESKDLANVVFLKLYNKLSMFKSYDSFGGWLRIMANHVSIDYLRTKRKRADLLGENEGRLPSSSNSVSSGDEIINRMTYEQILSEFEKLPESTRKVFEFFYVDNLTVEQISEVMKMPIGTIKSKLSRTRKELRKKFKKI